VLGLGLGLGEAEGLGDGDEVGLALTETVGLGDAAGRFTGAGPLFRNRKATGTMISPTSTVTTKVTAPHSRRSSCPKFTRPDSS
jgi:hypothetical protein